MLSVNVEQWGLNRLLYHRKLSNLNHKFIRGHEFINDYCVYVNDNEFMLNKDEEKLIDIHKKKHLKHLNSIFNRLIQKNPDLWEILKHLED